jgi:putative colanic acid biosynthesis acetyltransferase WcaB
MVLQETFKEIQYRLVAIPSWSFSKMIYFFQDWRANKGNLKGRLVLFFFRIAQLIRRAPKPIMIIGLPVLVLYRVGVEWLLGIELPWGLKVGAGLRLFHGMGLVINDKTVIGSNVVLRHNTTIGLKETLPFGTRASPMIGDNVDIGANVVILGPIKVGKGARIGAGAVVVKDVPDGATVVGNPARVVAIGGVDRQ